MIEIESSTTVAEEPVKHPFRACLSGMWQRVISQLAFSGEPDKGTEISSLEQWGAFPRGWLSDDNPED